MELEQGNRFQLDELNQQPVELLTSIGNSGTQMFYVYEVHERNQDNLNALL